MGIYSTRKSKRLIIGILLSYALSHFSTPDQSCASSCETYSATPPFLTNTLKPNVLFMLDISYSMKWASNQNCKHGWCGLESAPLRDFDSEKRYYGIFESGKNYKYNNSIPVNSAPYSGGEDAPYKVTVNTSKKGAFVEKDCTPGTNGNCWDGNFLNWLTSKRIDTVRAVLVGGKAESRSGFDYLQNGTNTWKLVGHNEPDDTDIYKASNSTSEFCPYPDTTIFRIYSPAKAGLPNTTYDPYAKLVVHSTPSKQFNIAVVVKEEPRGLVHDIQDKVRLGLSTYRYNTIVTPVFPSRLNGGTLHLAIPRNPFVRNPIPQGFRFLDTPIKADISDIVDAIEHHPLAQGTTPLAENLFEVGNYFKQEPPHYNDDSTESNFLISNEWDPYVYEVDGESKKIKCAKSSVILFTDGKPGYDNNVPASIGDYDKDGNPADCFKKTDNCNNNLDDVAKYLRYNFTGSDVNGNPIYEDQDLRPDLDDDQYLDIYTVGFGSSEPVQILEDAAENGNGVAYTAGDGDALSAALTSAFSTILKKTASGSSVSVLSKKATSGSVINQALFFPDKYFKDGSNTHNVTWTGSLPAYWYYNTKSVSNIRENTTDQTDTTLTGGTFFGLDILDDLILDFVIDDSGNPRIDKYNPITTAGSDYGAKDPDSKDDGSVGPKSSHTDLSEIKPIFDPGEKLLAREVDAKPDPISDSARRLIYGVTKSGTQAEFIQQNIIDFKDLLNLSASDLPSCLGTGNDAAKNLISYIRGASDSFTDPASGNTTKCRSRQVKGTTTGAAASDQLWKLGDIIYSTPKVREYTDFSMLFTGANDGMLHAFKIGKLRKDKAKTDQAVALCNTGSGNCDNDEIGDEVWSFIPQNIMPYLKYLADPEYKHIYTVDHSPYIIESGGKVILIGGMRLGGGVGCNNGSDWCGDTTGSLAIDSDTSPYQAPPPSATVASLTSTTASFITNPYNPNPTHKTDSSAPEFSPTTIGSDNIGLSSYFALDITDPNAPKFLWEFTDPQLGYSYSGPGFIKRLVNGNVKNYIMFLSGPINANGRSANGQELAAFILELNEDFTYKELYKIDSNIDGGNPFGNNVNKGFGGRLFTNGVDYNEDGNTDAVFFGGNWMDGSDWKGDVFLIAPKDDPPTTSGSNPQLNWVVKNVLNESLVPITNRIEHGACYDSHYIYFGSGRWFYKLDSPGETGDSSSINALYGIQIDECMEELVSGGDCSNSLKNAPGTDRGNQLCDANNQLISRQITWRYGNLAPKDSDYYMERSITDPFFRSNNIFFSTMQPASDPCDYGGTTRVWGFNCRTGHTMSEGCTDYTSTTRLTSVPLHLSGGNIENVGLGETTFSEEGGLATKKYVGVPPESRPSGGEGNSGKLNGEILLWIER